MWQEIPNTDELREIKTSMTYPLPSSRHEEVVAYHKDSDWTLVPYNKRILPDLLTL